MLVLHSSCRPQRAIVCGCICVYLLGTYVVTYVVTCLAQLNLIVKISQEMVLGGAWPKQEAWAPVKKCCLYTCDVTKMHFTQTHMCIRRYMCTSAHAHVFTHIK